MEGVYILHLDSPLKHARHYVGWAKKIDARLKHHKSGTGARFTQVLVELGIGFELVRVFEGKGKSFERRLKNRKHTAYYCPICSGGKEREYHPRG